MIAYGAPRDPTAVVGRRILAFGIDLLLIWAAMGAVLFVGWQDSIQRESAAEYRCAAADATRPDGIEVPDKRIYSQACLEWEGEVLYLDDADAERISSEMWLALFTVVTLDLVLLQGLTGASIGKAITGLRVVRPDGRKAGLGWTALRTLLLAVDALCCFLPGAVLVFSTKGHRRIGDMAGTTFVVDRKDVGEPVLVPGLTAPPVEAIPGYPGAGWGPPPPGPWGAPGPSAPPPHPGAPTPDSAPAGPSDDGPIWDEARDTYIQYDREASEWLEWDDRAKRWIPIDSAI